MQSCVQQWFFHHHFLAGNLNSPAAPSDAGSAMFTLEDIYNPLHNGAIPTQILAGKFYWGLQQGTATAGVNVTGSSLSMTIPDGFYSGDATAADISLGKKAWVDDIELIGTNFLCLGVP